MDRNTDLFRHLTDSILIIIISYLPFKEAARTCILSKRWRNLWFCTNNIEFDETFYAPQNVLTNGGGLPLPSEIKAVQRRIFIDFSRRWMLNYREPNVVRFRLALSNPNEFRLDMEGWIRLVITRGIKELDLYFSDPEWNEGSPDDHMAVFDLPSYVYEHEHGILQSLKLSACNFQVSNLKKFCALRTFSIGWVELTCSSLKVLISNCPLLENLSLKKCRNLKYLDISSPGLRLRSLSIDHCSPLDDGINICAPKLRWFKYFGSWQVFILESFWCLEEAELDFGLEFEFYEIGDHLCNILRDLYCVKVLTVCSYMNQVLPSGEEPLSLRPRLYDVRHLILKTGLHSNELPGIAFLLKSCPFLEFLTFEMGVSKVLQGYDPPYEFDGRTFWRTNVILFSCIRRKLKVVDIKGFKGHPNEMQILKYLLNTGRVLEMVTISVSKEMDPNGGNMESYRQNAQSLLQVQRASRSVRISIS